MKNNIVELFDYRAEWEHRLLRDYHQLLSMKEAEISTMYSAYLK